MDDHVIDYDLGTLKYWSKLEELFISVDRSGMLS